MLGKVKRYRTFVAPLTAFNKAVGNQPIDEAD